MKKLIILAVLSSSFLISCASVHPGGVGHSLQPSDALPVKISSDTIDFNKRDSFQFMEVTIENTSEEWLRIDKIRAKLPDPSESKVSVVLGQDLADWAEAKRAQAQVDHLNNQIIQAALVAGGIVASTSSNSLVSAAGSAATLGGLGWAAVSEIRDDKRNAEAVVRVPSTHLYAPVSVPAKMFLRRWILFNKPAGAKITSLVIDVTTIDGKKGTYEVPMFVP
ncbi:hypothetical protein ACLVWU_13885 [Bdellovibrio sp. HCB290]|uniref:hypothetical protein n=1 Tax=Bdellovibrio sp. HCB290 TaxID=3394356 RepID=UPI0039B4ABD8